LNNNKFLSFLGICRRAGKMTLGFDSVLKSVAEKESCLILLASDIAKNTEKNLNEKLSQSTVKVIKLPYGKEELYRSVGKPVGIISINDKGFADKITQLAPDNQ